MFCELINPLIFILGFHCGSAGKESTCNAGDLGSVPGLERSPGEAKGYPRQYSGLENSMYCIVHGVSKGQTQLSDFFTIVYIIFRSNHWNTYSLKHQNYSRMLQMWLWKSCLKMTNRNLSKGRESQGLCSCHLGDLPFSSHYHGYISGLGSSLIL